MAGADLQFPVHLPPVPPLRSAPDIRFLARADQPTAAPRHPQVGAEKLDL